MMQEINRDYIAAIIALPDGLDRMTRWVHQLIEERDTAQAIAVAVVKGSKSDDPA